MPALYRICLPKLPYIEPLGLRSSTFVTDKVFSAEEPEATIWTPILNILIPGFTPYSFNYSIVDASFERGRICQNSLHDNTSDIVFMPANLPINDDMIDIYGVIGQSKIEFMSSYNYTDEAKDADVMESVLSFKPSLWILILFLIVLFAWLLKSMQSKRTTCCQYSSDFMKSLDQVTTHFIGQNSIDGEGFGLKVLIITLTFFSLMVVQYYNGLIHTDLVVPVIPIVPYSYQDFASTAITVGFPSGASGVKYFEESSQNSPEKRLYDELRRRNVTIGDGLPVNQPDWARRFLGEEFYKQLYRLSKDHVNIDSQVHLMSLLAQVCRAKVYSQAHEVDHSTLKTHFAPKFKKLFPWISSDPDTRHILHGFIKRKEFIPEKKSGKGLRFPLNMACSNGLSGLRKPWT